LGQASLIAAAGTTLSRVGMASSLVVVPIIAPSSEIRDISRGMLERIFLGRSVQSDAGQRYVPFSHPPKTRTRVLFDSAVLGMNPDEVARYWVDQRIRGNAHPPRAVPSPALLKQVVRQFPGAIAYVAVEDLDDSVRALSVGGVPYSSSDFPIR
jgi:hypothetical protein